MDENRPSAGLRSSKECIAARIKSTPSGLKNLTGAATRNYQRGFLSAWNFFAFFANIRWAFVFKPVWLRL